MISNTASKSVSTPKNGSIGLAEQLERKEFSIGLRCSIPGNIG